MEMASFAERDHAPAINHPPARPASGFAAISSAVMSTDWSFGPLPAGVTTAEAAQTDDGRAALAALRESVRADADQVARWNALWPLAGAVINPGGDIVDIDVSIEAGGMIERDEALLDAVKALIHEAVGDAPILHFQTQYRDGGIVERTSYFVRVTAPVQGGGITLAAAECRSLRSGVGFSAHMASSIKVLPGLELRTEGDWSNIQTIATEAIERLIAGVRSLRQSYDWEATPTVHRPRARDAVSARVFDMSPEAVAAREAIVARRNRLTSQPGPRGGYDSFNSRWDPLNFSSVGQELHAAGFCVFPQKNEKTRGPASGSGFFPSKHYEGRQTTAREVESWAIGGIGLRGHLGAIGHANTGLVTGPASDDIIFIDIDETDFAASVEMQRLAEGSFGPTPFVRVGNEPKLALGYRLAESHRERIEPVHLAGSDSAIEFLGYKSQITVYGTHYKTERAFRWERHPLGATTRDFPTITLGQILDYKAALARNFEVRAKVVGVAGDRSVLPEAIGSIAVVIPGESEKWPVGPTGKITDGREKFLLALTWDLACANPTIEHNDEDLQALTEVAVKVFADRCDTGGRPEAWVYKQAKDKLKRAADKVRANPQFINYRVKRSADGKVTLKDKVIVPEGAFSKSASGRFDWLTSKEYRPRTESQYKFEDKGAQALFDAMNDRALLLDRSKVWEAVRVGVDAVFDQFWDSVSKRETDGLLRVLAAPTGSGKSSRTIAALVRALLADLAKPEADRIWKAGERIIFVVKNHRVARELLRQAAKAGAITLDHNSAGCTEDGVIAALVSGKARAAASTANGCVKCPLLPLMQRSADVELPLGNACEMTRARQGQIKQGERKTETLVCRFKAAGQCGYYRQPKLYARAQILIVTSPYLTMANPPSWMTKGCRGLIVDEDPTLQIARERRLPLNVMKSVRVGAPSSRLKKAGYTSDDLPPMRDAFMRLVESELRAGRDPAEALVDHEHGDTLCAVVRSLLNRDGTSSSLQPNMTETALEALLENRPKRPGVAAELALVQVIEDRMQRIRQDREARAAWNLARTRAHNAAHNATTDAERAIAASDLARLDANPPQYEAVGVIDPRLQLRVPEGDEAKAEIRVSRIVELNFSGVPALLLDASANEDLVSRAFERKVEVTKVQAPLHLLVAACLDRSFSDHSILPQRDEGPDAIAAKERLIDMIRLLISKSCDHVAPGRFAVASTRKARDRILMGWVAPSNCDFFHFGALRGIDGAKDHAGIMVVGRSQMPPDVIDGLAAAFASRDRVPYTPFDALGTGRTADDKPLYRAKEYRELKMRSGWDIQREVREMPEGLARAVDHSWREEEIRQAIGRLRPVYRTGEPPLVIVLGTALPSDIIVDEVFRIEDAVGDEATKIADARRRADLIVADKPPLEGPSYRPTHLDEARHVELKARELRAKDAVTPFASLVSQAYADFARIWRTDNWTVLTWLPATVYASVDEAEAIIKLTGHSREELDAMAIEAQIVDRVPAELRLDSADEPADLAPDVWIDAPALAWTDSCEGELALVDSG